MTGFEFITATDAAPDRVWGALVDIEDWPSWTPSYKWIRRLDQGPLRVGSRAKVKQPGLRSSVWEVTHLDEARGFTWASSAGGVRVVGRHRLIPDGDATRIILSIEQSGVLAGLIGRLYGKRIRRFVQLEAHGIKAAAEAATA
jgi:hypothetical protein